MPKPDRDTLILDYLGAELSSLGAELLTYWDPRQEPSVDRPDVVLPEQWLYIKLGNELVNPKREEGENIIYGAREGTCNVEIYLGWVLPAAGDVAKAGLLRQKCGAMIRLVEDGLIALRPHRDTITGSSVTIEINEAIPGTIIRAFLDGNNHGEALIPAVVKYDEYRS